MCSIHFDPLVQVSSTLALMCPFTLRTLHLDAKQFFAAPFKALAGSRLLIKYQVLDCEPNNERAGRFQLGEVQVLLSALQTWHICRVIICAGFHLQWCKS